MKSVLYALLLLFFSSATLAQTQPCAASFTYTNSSSGVYAFTNTSSGGAGATYAWNFGDGTTSTAFSPSHTYANAGTYCVVLTVATGTGCTAVDTQCISVTGTGTGGFSCANVNAAFTYTDTNWTFTFSNTTINTNTAPATVAYSWSFGDGGTDTLASPWHFYSSPGTYNVYMIATWSANGVVLCTDTFQQQVVIAGPPPINELVATAVWDASISAGNASVMFWLINYDSTTQMLTAVDSALMPCFSNVSFIDAYWTNLPSGDYRVKAHMINQPSSWTTGLLPTYADSAFNWQNATVISHSGARSGAAIYLQQGLPMNGPGFISGNVLQGANKGTAVGDPMRHITVYLRNAANKPVASTETDANGMYSFRNVPVGSYNVYPEEMNYATTPSATIQITAANPRSTANDFWRETIAKTLHPMATAVQSVSLENAVRISPNPAHDRLNIQFPTTPQKGAVLQLYNLSGQLVKSYEINDAQPAQQLSLSGIAAGNYLLHIPTAGGKQVSRITIQP